MAHKTRRKENVKVQAEKPKQSTADKNAKKRKKRNSFVSMVKKGKGKRGVLRLRRMQSYLIKSLTSILLPERNESNATQDGQCHVILTY